MQKHYIFFVLYLFSYYQLSPAIEFTVAKQLETSDTQLIQNEDNNANNTQLVENEDLRSHPREKRFLATLFIAIAAGIINGTISRILGDQISKLIKGERLKRSDNHVSLINSRLNLNYNNAMDFKRKITSLNPTVGNAIMVNSHGFRCDSNFCAGKQVGHYAMGLCSKYMCVCTKYNGRPGPLECGGGLVFDPEGRNCNYPTNMALCGY